MARRGSFYVPFAEKVILAPLANRIIAALPKKQVATPQSTSSSTLTGANERVRTDLGNGDDTSRAEKSAGKGLNAVRSILQRIHTSVAGWNGHFHVIYLPDIAHFRFGPHPLRQQLLSLASELGISVIDMVPVFEAEKEPHDLFAFGVHGGHCNARGYELVARAVFEKVSTGAVASTKH